MGCMNTKNGEIRKKTYAALLIISSAAALAAAVIGEILLKRTSLPHPAITGIFFAAFAALLIAGAAACEAIFDRLPRESDEALELRSVLICIAAAVVAFAAGSCFQYIYEYESTETLPPPVKQYALIIDNSGSMADSDPTYHRFAAVQEMVSQIPVDMPVSVYLFGSDTICVRDFANRDTLAFAPDESWKCDMGGTRLKTAIERCLSDIEVQTAAGKIDGSTRLILLTDGYCQELSGTSFGTRSVVRNALKHNSQIYSIGFGAPDEHMLSRLSEATGGKYYHSDSVYDISESLSSALSAKVDASRMLMGVRSGIKAFSRKYVFLRILFLFLLFSFVSVSTAFSLNCKDSFMRLLLTGMLKSLAASYFTELLLQNSAYADSSVRVFVCILAGTIFIAIEVPERLRNEQGPKNPHRRWSYIKRLTSYRDMRTLLR